MSPELLASGANRLGRPFDAAAADVWALGICLFLMVSGIYPFEVCNPPACDALAYAQ